MFDSRLNNFDLIRLLAAFQVLMAHSISHFNVGGNIVTSLLGYLPGVPIFFFTSGFLISLSYEKSDNYKRYTKNRFLRIYPALWVAFIISIFSILLTDYKLIFNFEFVKWVAAQLTFLQFYNPDFMRNYGVGVLNGSLWTIPVEIAFYIILPIMYQIGRKFKNINIVLYGLGGVSIFIDWYFVTTSGQYGDNLLHKLLGVSVFPYLWMFIVGILFQRKWKSIKHLIEGKFYFWSVVITILIMTDVNFEYIAKGNHPNILYYIVIAFFISSLAVHLDGSWSIWLRGNDVSYGVYIYHMIIINFMVYMNKDESILFLVLTVFLTFLMALISWKMIERPALKLKNKTIHRL